MTKTKKLSKAELLEMVRKWVESKEEKTPSMSKKNKINEMTKREKAELEVQPKLVSDPEHTSEEKLAWWENWLKTTTLAGHVPEFMSASIAEIRRLRKVIENMKRFG